MTASVLSPSATRAPRPIDSGPPPAHVSTRTAARPPTPCPLTAARQAAGLTKADLARRLFVSRPTVSAWEAGRRRPGSVSWPTLAAVLGLSADDVAGLFADHPPSRLDGQRLPGLSSVRAQLGLTQQALATVVGVAPSTVSTWETGGRVAAGMLADLAQALSAEPAALTADPAVVPTPDQRPLRRLRRRAHMSRREAAVQLGIAEGSLARYEAGSRRPSIAVARRMAAVYRTPLAAVLAMADIALPALPPHRPWRGGDVSAGIRAARLAAGLSKKGLGIAVMRSGQAVDQWERGRRLPDQATRRRLERVLHLPAGTLPSDEGGFARAVSV